MTWTGSEVKTDGTSTPWSVMKKVTKFDDKTKMWTVKVDKMMGSSTTTEEWVTSCLWAPDMWQNEKMKCVMEGGTLESATVDTGTYDTCRFTVMADDGRMVKTWWGDVPFGIVKKEITDPAKGTKTTLGLHEIKMGQ